MGLGGFVKPDLDVRRERRIDISSPTPGEEDVLFPPIPTPEAADAISKDVISKAQQLLDELKRMLKTLPIPVSEKALDIRAAVKRTDPSSDGTQISYDLYSRIKMAAFERVDSLDLQEFAAHLTGHGPTDSRTWTSFKSRTGDPDPLFGSEFADMAIHLALIISLNQLLGITDAADKAESTLTPNPAVSALQSGIGIGLLKAIHGSNGTDGQSILSSLGIDLKGSMTDALNTANANLDAGREDFSDVLPIQQADECVIHDYIQGFLSRTSDPGYVSWRVADRAMSTYWRQKSLNSSPTLKKSLSDKTVEFPQDMWCLAKQESISDARRLNSLVALLSSRYDSGSICCVTRWLGAIGSSSVSDLEDLRDWLSLINGFTNVRLTFNNNLGFQLNDFFRRRVLFAIIDALDSFIGSSGARFLEWASKSASRWSTLFRCPPIEDLILEMLRSIDAGTELTKQWVSEMFERYQVSELEWSSDSELLADMGISKTLLDILDNVIGAIKNGQLCSFEEDRLPDVREVLRITGQNFGPDSIPIVTRGENLFSEYQSVSLRTSSGRIMPTVDTTQERRQSQDVIDECLQKLSGSDVVDMSSLESELQKEIKNAKKRIGLF